MIQASLGAPQPKDTEERQALLSALEKAKRQAEVSPMEKQILATEEYLARAKKRLLQKAEDDKEVDVQGVAGEDLLKKLKTQAADLTLPMCPIADLVGEVARLQQVVADLQRQLQQAVGDSTSRRDQRTGDRFGRKRRLGSDFSRQRTHAPGSIWKSCIGPTIFTGHSQVHPRSGITTVRKLQIVDQNGRRYWCPRRQKGGPTQASPGVQGLHVVNIADDSDEELSDTESEHLETQSRVRRLRLTWTENQNVEKHRDAPLDECLVRGFGYKDWPPVARCADPRSSAPSEMVTVDCASCLGSCRSGGFNPCAAMVDARSV